MVGDPIVPQPDQIPVPDTSGLPAQSAPNQFAMENSSQAMQAQPSPPPVANPSAIKGLLTNFFGGMGRAMMVHAGLPTPEEAAQKQQQIQLQQQNANSLEGIRTAQQAATELHPYQMPPAPDGTPGEVIQTNAAGIKAIQVQQLKNQSKAQANPLAMLNSQLRARGLGYEIAPDATTGELKLNPLSQEQLSPIQQGKLEKTPTEMRMRLLSDQGDPQATRILGKMQSDKMALQKERGISFAQGRAQYTPFETVIPGTNTPTTISNMQALQTGAPKVPMGAQTKLGGQYALFNDAYGILDKVDRLADQVHLSDPGVSSRVAAGYAAIKDPAAKGLTGEILSNVLARQPVYNSLSGPERDLVLTMAQGKAAGMGLRGIMGQAGTNEMQQRLDSALFPGGQTAASTESLKQQTEATRQLLDRFIVGQPEVGLNAPGQPSALRTKRGVGGTAEPARPAQVPAGYKFNANGPKGPGWYKP